MGSYEEFKEIVDVFHSTSIIENSRGATEYKSTVQLSREKAEDEARLLLERHRNRWSHSDFNVLIRNVNVNGFPTQPRFSEHFYENLDNIDEVGIEQTREAVGRLLDESCSLEERIRDFRRMYGRDAKGLFSSILYIYDPFEFTPLMRPIVDNLNRYELNKGMDVKYSLLGYDHYCDCMRTVESDFDLT